MSAQGTEKKTSHANIDHTQPAKIPKPRYVGAGALTQAARLLCPYAPHRTVARLTGVPKETVRTWGKGTRCPPIAVLEQITESLRQRHDALTTAIWALRQEIDRRKAEPQKLQCHSVRQGERRIVLENL